jgi:hypothetical protein
MISSLKSAEGSCGAYIDAAAERQATRRHAGLVRQAVDAGNYNNFTNMNPAISQQRCAASE